MTPDERSWLLRTATFYWALVHGDWRNTFLVAHPGVTVMLSGLPAYVLHFPEIAQWPSIPRDSAQLEAMLWQSSSPVELLAAARQFVILLLSLATTAAYFPLSRLFNKPAAILGVLFMSWSPLFLSVSSLLHPDGLLTAFTILAVLLLSVWLYAGGSVWHVVFSGIALALAALAKSTAVVVVVWGLMVIALHAVRQEQRSRRRLAQHAAGAFVWLMTSAVVYVALWPAMWVDAPGAISRMFSQMLGYAIGGHSLPSFFLSRVVDSPGPLFYPIAFVFRTSPVTLIGLVALAWCWHKRYALLNCTASRDALAGLLLFALLFIVTMSLGAKKFDRYILPAMAALDIAAAVGLTSAIWAIFVRDRETDRLSNCGELKTTRSALLAMALIAILYGAVHVRNFPYFGTYFNLLVGGPRLAPNVMMVGWGEGLDQVGRWLTEQSDDPITVVSWYEKGPLSYFLRPDDETHSFIESDHYWFDADFAVLYQNQVQRENPSKEVIDYFLGVPEDLIVRHAGLDLAWVYDLRGSRPPDFTRIKTDTAGPVSDAIDLDAYRWQSDAVAPGEEARIVLFLESPAGTEDDLIAEVELVDPSGAIVWQERRRPGGFPTDQWPPGEIIEDKYAISIPANAGQAVYALRTRFVEESAETPLAVADRSNAQVRTVAELHVQELRLVPALLHGELFPWNAFGTQTRQNAAPH